MFESSFDAAATVIRSLWSSSKSRQRMPRYRSQYEQSAAPPAIVPSRKGLISMTFLTVCEAMYAPADARESTATTTPALYLKARVVVPCTIFTRLSAPSQRCCGSGSIGAACSMSSSRAPSSSRSPIPPPGSDAA